MTASNDAVGSNTGNGKPTPRRRLPWLLTAAVLMLIYQQVPPPFGVTAIQSWLHYAIWVAGTLLLAQYARDNAQSARTLARRMGVKMRQLKEGFQFSFNPRQTEDAAATSRDSGDDHI